LKSLRRFSILVLLPLLVPLRASAQGTLDALAIEVRGASREFAYTNKRAAFLYGETNADNRTSWQGQRTRKTPTSTVCSSRRLDN
jgi:hypothetical protein